MTEHQRPDEKTRQTEREDADVKAGADRMPTEEEERLAEQQELDPEVAARAEEMYERGAKAKGEGRI